MTITLVVLPVHYLFALVQVLVLCSVHPIAAVTPEQYLQSHGVAMVKESVQLKRTCFIIVSYLPLNESSHSSTLIYVGCPKPNLLFMLSPCMSV